MTSNFLTVDLEEWYHVNYSGIDVSPHRQERTNLERLVDRFLELFAAHDAKVTFFVLAEVAEKYPSTIRRVASSGHEIASHGYAHRSVHEMRRKQFAEDVRRSCGVLEGIASNRVLGFRAPSFSVDRADLQWYYEELESAGLTYSSSIFCGRTFLYGIPGFPYQIHAPHTDTWRTSVVEFPITRVTWGAMTVALYFRMFPAWFLNRAIRKENRLGRHAMLYIHPREIDPDQPRLPLKGGERFIHYYGLRTCESKLEQVLQCGRGSFITVKSYLEVCPEF